MCNTVRQKANNQSQHKDHMANSFTNGRSETLCRDCVKVSPHILALLFDLPSVLHDNSLSITEHFQTETENASIRAMANIVSLILVKFDAVIQDKNSSGMR